MAAEVLRGLSLPAKAIPPKYFYDAEGSRLFDVITKLPGYYLTRVETAILRDNRERIARRVGTGTCLVEYGSGSSVKSRLLIEACRPAAYVPVDISRDHLEQSARAIFASYPELAVYPTCADYTTPFQLPPPAAGLQRLAFFPGSSIGNFEPAAAGEFLRGVAQVVDAGGWLVVGVDAKKDRDVLDGAYTDVAGITEQFNKNLLANINAALGADFDLAGFRHLAVYNEQAGRIEMYLVSQRDQRVTVAGTEITFAKDETTAHGEFLQVRAGPVRRHRRAERLRLRRCPA